jgi:23S rRNA pseudouridine1911/1915/1917 synthase
MSQRVDESLPEAARRIDKIVRALTNMSVRQAQGLFDAGGVSLNGAVCKEPWKWLKIGDEVAVEYEANRRYKAAPKARKYAGFELIHEDAHLLVVSKQANLLTVPTDNGETNTLLHRLSDYLARGRQHRPKIWIVHRLDRGVSGLLVFGKRAEISTQLRAQMAEHKPLRRYLAIVAGTMKQEEGTFDSYLATSEGLTRYSVPDADKGERAITHYRVVERLPEATLVELRLETGKRNQIRVHLAEAGHPVLGDERYKPQQAKHRLWKVKRLALTAVELGFAHPITGEELRFEVPPAPEMTTFLTEARARIGVPPHKLPT